MGFFNLSSISGTSTAAIKKVVKSGCDSCGLTRSSYAEFEGPADAKVLFVFDYPCRERREDPMRPSPMYRRAHSLLVRWARAGMIPPLEECAFTNAVPCPCSRQECTVQRSRCCEDRLHKLIKSMKPKVVIPLGIVATQALISGRLSGRIANTQASDFYGKCIPDRHFNTWICPTYDCPFVDAPADHPMPDAVPMKLMLQHVQKAFEHVDKSFPTIPTDIRTTADPEKAARMIKNAIADALKVDPNPKISIDYETTGIKPHRDGQEIVVASMAWQGANGMHALGFKWDGFNKNLVDAWHDLFKPGTPVRLIAHKADFETCWTHFRAGYGNSETDWPTNWDWDTCIGAHVINNNQKVGLKFHTYTELGILGYDDAADPFLSGTMPNEEEQYKGSCNSFNLLKDKEHVPWLSICDYCAQDSLYTLILRNLQYAELASQDFTVGREFPDGTKFQGKTMMEFFKFFLEGMVTLAKVQSGGLPIDLAEGEKRRKELEADKAKIYREILATDEAKAYAKKTGTLLSPTSPTQLVKLFYEILQVMEAKEGEKPEVSVEALEKIDLPIAKLILRLRRLAKLGGTFLSGYLREAVYDEKLGQHVIRPFFNLSTGSGGESGGPRTYRSSADSPNFQNIPKQDKEMKKLVRSLFKAPPGWHFMEADYKSLEVMISASYHHDPNMVKYLCDPHSDMHRDTACDMYIRKPEELDKKERQSIKTGYVFSSFYGATYKSCAQRMWENMPDFTKEHLAKDCGIDTYDKWVEHVKKGDEIFWGERFKVYGEWRQQEWARYQQNGFVEGYLGCRCYGPMGFTECANRCIQGSGCHTLMWALTKDVKDFERLGLQSRIVGQIHDAIILLVKDEENEVVEDILYKNGVVGVMDAFKWIHVPLVIEAETSESGGSWAVMGGEHALAFSANARTNGAQDPNEAVDWVDLSEKKFAAA